jgi:hypothetical protein
MSVGVMKDYNPKLRNLLDSHTLDDPDRQEQKLFFTTMNFY